MIIQGNNQEPATINYSANNKKFVFGNFVYIPILKNAHRYTAKFLSAYNFTLDEQVSVENKKIIITLRDPIERWYAGTSQFLYMHHKNLNIDNETINLLSRLVVLDGHSRSQTNFLKGINTEMCIFFNCDEAHYSDHLQDYCRRNFGGKVQIDNSPQNFNTLDPNYLEIKRKLKELCLPEHKERLRSYYREDFELINNITFYRG